jgi:hypothetical protein
MGVSAADMHLYMDMFARHNEISRTVEEISGGVRTRTTTGSDSPYLAAQLKTHVSSMYSHLGDEAEVMCMSQTLPTLFRNASGYRRRVTVTPTGVIVDESSLWSPPSTVGSTTITPNAPGCCWTRSTP